MDCTDLHDSVAEIHGSDSRPINGSHGLSKNYRNQGSAGSNHRPNTQNTRKSGIGTPQVATLDLGISLFHTMLASVCTDAHLQYTVGNSVHNTVCRPHLTSGGLTQRCVALWDPDTSRVHTAAILRIHRIRGCNPTLGIHNGIPQSGSADNTCIQRCVVVC